MNTYLQLEQEYVVSQNGTRKNKTRTELERWLFTLQNVVGSSYLMYSNLQHRSFSKESKSKYSEQNETKIKMFVYIKLNITLLEPLRTIV